MRLAKEIISELNIYDALRAAIGLMGYSFILIY